MRDKHERSIGNDIKLSDFAPQRGGALHGIGEKFAPDLHTGMGNFPVPTHRALIKMTFGKSEGMTG
jgi:hypothetical protein